MVERAAIPEAVAEDIAEAVEGEAVMVEAAAEAMIGDTVAATTVDMIVDPIAETETADLRP
jgi:hypothetical protein